jgi:hypothetical protein
VSLVISRRRHVDSSGGKKLGSGLRSWGYNPSWIDSCRRFGTTRLSHIPEALEYGTDRLCRNVSNRNCTLRNIPEELWSHAILNLQMWPLEAYSGLTSIRNFVNIRQSVWNMLGCTDMCTRSTCTWGTWPVDWTRAGRIHEVATVGLCLIQLGLKLGCPNSGLRVAWCTTGCVMRPTATYSLTHPVCTLDLLQVRSLVQSRFSTERDLVLPFFQFPVASRFLKIIQ